MTDSIEIPTTNSGFSMITSSIKVSPTDFDNERLPEIESTSPKGLYYHVRLSVVVAIARCQFIRAGPLGVAENPIFAVGIVILPLVVQEIIVFPVFYYRNTISGCRTLS